ncbi:MAG: hypothetical protein JXQ29_04275, partial [Planctomycetes bacterium]|nr:hypothetical protein [Planctomycetota bacterium]
APDLAAALTLLDSLEFFLVLADAPVDSGETRAFCEAAARIDRALQVFLFTGADGEVDRVPLPANAQLIRRPFLLSELHVLADRAREDYGSNPAAREVGPAFGSG